MTKKSDEHKRGPHIRNAIGCFIDKHRYVSEREKHNNNDIVVRLCVNFIFVAFYHDCGSCLHLLNQPAKRIYKILFEFVKRLKLFCGIFRVELLNHIRYCVATAAATISTANGFLFKVFDVKSK